MSHQLIIVVPFSKQFISAGCTFYTIADFPNKIKPEPVHHKANSVIIIIVIFF